MDKNVIKAAIEFVEGLGRAVAAVGTVAEQAGAVVDRVKGNAREDKSVGIEVSTKPNGDVLLSCARFRLSFTPDRARALGRRLITQADSAEKADESEE